MPKKPSRPTIDNNDGTFSIPLSRGLYAIVDADDLDMARVRWFVSSNGYAIRHVGTSQLQTQRDIFLHRAILERIIERPLVKFEYVDHLDGNRLNNRRSNLRIATQPENARNRKINKNSSVGLKGVTPAGTRFRAQIQSNRRKIHLGTYDTKEQAHAAYVQRAVELHGKFAKRE